MASLKNFVVFISPEIEMKEKSLRYHEDQIWPDEFCSGNRDLMGSFVTGSLWISYNTLMLCIFLCFAKRVKRKNVFYEYSLVWFICFLNFIASLLNILLFFYDYYSDNHPYPINVPWPILRATLSITTLGNIV